jgi:hypothetical protein
MKLLIIAVLASLSGCAMSPKEVKSYGSELHYVTGTSAPATATCIARNVSNLPGAMFAAQQLYPGAIEVAVHEAHDASNTLSVWRISGLTYGSKLTVFVSPRFRNDPEVHFMTVKGPC